MRKIYFFLLAATLFCSTVTVAQTKIKDGTVTGTSLLPNSNAILELESANKGLLFPRVALTSTANAAPLAAHVKGMTVFNTAHVSDVDSGLYYNDGVKWVRLASSTDSAKAWSLTGNAGTTAPTVVGAPVGSANFWGTTDAQNVAIGTNSITRAIIDTFGNMYGGFIYGGISNTIQPGTVGNLVWGGSNTITNDLSLSQARVGYNLISGLHNIYSNSADLYGGTGANTIMSGDYNTATGASNAVFGEANQLINNGGASGYNNNQNIIAGYGNTISVTNLGVSAGQNAVFGNSNTLTNGLSNVMGGNQNNIVNTNDVAVFGQSNIDSSTYTLMAGSNNIVTANASASAVFGSSNNAQSVNNVIGGNQNIIYSGYGSSAVFGGANTIGSATSTIGNCGVNMVAGYGNTVNGGTDEFIFGASDNILSQPNGHPYANFMAGNSNTITSVGTGLEIGGNAAFGWYNTITATGTNYGSFHNMVFGYGNTARGFSNIVGGGNNGGEGNVLSEGSTSCAMFGVSNTINLSGQNSFVTGSHNTANSSNQLVVGLGLIANNPQETVIGQYNQPANNALLTIGNGTSSSNSSNAITVTNTSAVPTATANNSTLNVNGSVAANIVTVTGDYTLTATDYTVIFHTGAADATFTLPDPTTCKGRIYHLVNADENSHIIHLNYPVNLFGGGSFTSVTINSGGSSNGSGVGDDNTGNTGTIQSDGIVWWRISL